MIIGARRVEKCATQLHVADETAAPIEFLFETGNTCVVTPAMRRDRKNPGLCSIAVMYDWGSPPVPADQKEIEAYIADWFGGPPQLTHKTRDRQEAIRFGDEFLDPGKRH